MTDKLLIIEDFVKGRRSARFAVLRKELRKWYSQLATSGSKPRIVEDQTPLRKDDPILVLFDDHYDQHQGDTP